MYKVFVRILITVTVVQFCFPQTDAVKIRVGLYNYIPDLNGDKLQSYKKLVEEGFASDSYTVEAVVDGNKYSPYGKLDEYLVNFDLIEIDTATLAQVAQKGLIKEVHDIYIYLKTCYQRLWKLLRSMVSSMDIPHWPVVIFS